MNKNWRVDETWIVFLGINVWDDSMYSVTVDRVSGSGKKEKY